MTPGRLPYAPLERLLRASYDSVDWQPDHHTDGGRHGHWDGLTWIPDNHIVVVWSDTVAARLLDVDQRSIARWKAHGMPPSTADAAAIAAGHHPLEIWGQAWTCAEITAGLLDRRRNRQPTARQRAQRLIDAALAEVRRQQRAVRLELVSDARNLPTLRTGCDTEAKEAAA